MKTEKQESPFQLGKEIPTVWIHMEFDFKDSMKYMREDADRVIKTQEEADRLTKKYWE